MKDHPVCNPVTWKKAAEAMKWEQAAEEWGTVAIRELLLGVAARGIVKRQHFEEAARAARLAARYAVRFLGVVEVPR